MAGDYLNKKEKAQLWKLAAFETTLESIIDDIEKSPAERKDLLKWLRSARTFNNKAMQEYIDGLSGKKVQEYLNQFEGKEFYLK